MIDAGQRIGDFSAPPSNQRQPRWQAEVLYISEMRSVRKYQDHEIRQILELAVGEDESPAQSLPAGDGLTLAQLQDIGRDVGVPANRINQAVAAFEGRGESVPRGHTLGLPTSIGRVVSLPRDLSHREWELLIAELRTTFGVTKTVTSHGSLREWSHGGLHAFIEPTETGHNERTVASQMGARNGAADGADQRADGAAACPVARGATYPLAQDCHPPPIVRTAIVIGGG